MFLARFVALCVQICGPVCADFQKATNNLVKDSNAECGTECGTGDLSCTDLAHNASIPSKLGNFPENFLFSQWECLGCRFVE